MFHFHLLQTLNLAALLLLTYQQISLLCRCHTIISSLWSADFAHRYNLGKFYLTLSDYITEFYVSKAEFSVTGLSQQLSKLYFSTTVSTTHWFAGIFDTNFSFSEQQANLLSIVGLFLQFQNNEFNIQLLFIKLTAKYPIVNTLSWSLATSLIQSCQSKFE